MLSRKWIYYEQDGFLITLANYLHGKTDLEQLGQLFCFICTKLPLLPSSTATFVTLKLSPNTTVANALTLFSGLVGLANIVLNDSFAVGNVSVVQGKNGMFVAMPSYKAGNKYKDVCFPITKEFREKVNNAVLETYHQAGLLLSQVPVKRNPSFSPLHQHTLPFQR